MDCDPPSVGLRKVCEIDRLALTAALAWGLLASAWSQAAAPALGQPSGEGPKPPSGQVVLPESVLDPLEPVNQLYDFGFRPVLAPAQ